MVTDQQVRLLMSLMKEGLPLVTAAAKAGMSERTGRKYKVACKVPSQMKQPHRWRTRPDPFAEVWAEIAALLEQDGALQAKTVFAEFQRRHPGRFRTGQLRTLQRRFRRWRARRGPEREVYFPQVHSAAEQCQSDFTDLRELGITLGGEPFAHLLYHFVLTYSNWEWVSVCFSESFEALSEGLQAALWRLGGVPVEHRTDNLSAATHELRVSRGRGFTVRYRELLEHYGMAASRNHPGNAHENGDVESAHGVLKRALDQRLRLRGGREFACREDYEAFLQAFIEECNARRDERVGEERAHLRPLPARPLPAYRELYATVSRSSTVRVVGKTYSVPSRLIGHRLRVRLYASAVELEYQGEVVERLERLSGHGASYIDYRHLIHALVRKPGAFRRYAFREALFPSVVFRRTYDALRARETGWADLDYLRILHLAAGEGEVAVGGVLAALLDEAVVPAYEVVRARVRRPVVLPSPTLQLVAPDLSGYDRLIGAEVAA